MTALLISIVGALSAITVSLIGAWLANRNSIILQTEKLKEDYYIAYEFRFYYHFNNNILICY